MSSDTKRISGPKETFNALDFIRKPDDCASSKKLKLVRNGKRCNGRDFAKARPLFMKTGLLNQADGSAYVEVDRTKVMAAVYGPREVTKKEEFSLLGQLSCEVKYATFSCIRRRSAVPEADEKDLSAVVLEAIEPSVCLHKFPKAQFNIYVTVIENDGGVLSSCINCASLALANAGVEMYDLVTSVSARLYKDHILLDPSLQEEQCPTVKGEDKSDGCVTLALMPSLHQVTTLSSRGNIHTASLSQATKLCTEACRQLYSVHKRSLISHLNKLPEHKT